MSEEKLCIVLLNHGNWRDTRECLESLTRTTHTATAVVVIDTGSANDSVERLREWVETGGDEVPATAAWERLPAAARQRPGSVERRDADGATTAGLELPLFGDRLTLAVSPRPLGFAAGCNAGLRLALGDPAVRWVWLLNNDAIAAPDAAQRLVAAAVEAGPDLGALGTTIAEYTAPDRIQILGGGRVRAWSAETRFPGHGRPLAAARQTLAEIEAAGGLDYVSGASLFTAAATARRNGPLDETMHLYWEDTDWCARLRGAGLRLAVCPEAIVWHKGQASTGGINAYTKYHHFRSAAVYMRRHRAVWPLPLLTRLAKSVTRDLAAARPRHAAACVRGLGSGLRVSGRPAPAGADRRRPR